ncbi:1870_t:CDS:2, partial [Dentiscutata erythropus]
DGTTDPKNSTNIEDKLGIENKSDIECEEDSSGIELEVGIEDEFDIEYKEDGSGIELEENTDIISESDNVSKKTDNYQYRHLYQEIF